MSKTRILALWLFFPQSCFPLRRPHCLFRLDKVTEVWDEFLSVYAYCPCNVAREKGAHRSIERLPYQLTQVGKSNASLFFFRYRPSLALLDSDISVLFPPSSLLPPRAQAPATFSPTPHLFSEPRHSCFTQRPSSNL